MSARTANGLFSAPPAQAVAGSATARAAASEVAMRFMLVLVIAFLTISDAFEWNPGLAPGLSAKNALLYLLAAALVLKLTITRDFGFELRGVHVGFALLIGYAVLSMLAAAFVVGYDRYNLFQSAINLKSRLVDQAIFFLVFFYGLRESRNAFSIFKVLLCAVAIANLMAMLDAWGIVSIGDIEEREDGRMQGIMGESNQYAAFVTLFIPAFVAALFHSRGVRRLGWLVALLISTGALIMAVSRGAFVAVFVAAVWGGFLLRRHISASKVVGIAGAGLLVIVIAVAALSVRYGDLLYQRVLGDSSSSDIVGASSGRTEIWATAIARMADTPATLFTGFGWDVYWAMPFRYSPHNHYISLWFNLGLVGLVCGTMLLVYVVREARQAVDRTPVREQQLVLAGFVFGALGIAIATFFVDLYTPWLWFWAYAGLVMRIAVNTRIESRIESQAEVHGETAMGPRADAFGWVARAADTRNSRSRPPQFQVRER